MSDLFNIFDKFNKKEILNNEKEIRKLQSTVENFKKIEKAFVKILEDKSDYEKKLLQISYGERYSKNVKAAQQTLDKALEKANSQRQKKVLNKLFAVEIRKAQDIQQKINNEIGHLIDNSLETITTIKKEKEKLLKQLDKILEKISSLRSKIESAHRLYSSKAAKNNRSYRSGMSNLASNRTTLSEVWEALDSYNQIKEDIEPLLEKEKMKKKSLDLRIEKIDELIEKIEDEYIANKIKPNHISEEIKNCKNPESELTNEIYIKDAKKEGYVPASEFIELVRVNEGVGSLDDFLETEPDVLNVNEEEVFVVLTRGTFSYSPKRDEFIFRNEIQYEKLEKTFQKSTAFALKSQLNKPHKSVVEAYLSGEVIERINMYKSSNMLTDQIEIHKWEAIKNCYETGYYETDSQKEERIKLEIEEKERIKLEAKQRAEIKQKSIEFIKNVLPIYKSFYSKVNETILDSFFFDDKENQIIGERWLDEKVEFKKSKNGKILKIKPCIAGCVSSKEVYKFVYKTPPTSTNLRVYECEASQRSNFKGWHLTSKNPFDDDYY